MAVFRDRVLLLKRTPFGESSLVVHVLAREHGRVHLLAKGAYRPTSGYFAVLDLFDTLELEWSQSERAELGLLRRGSLQVRRRPLVHELERYRAALAMLELGEMAALEGALDAGLYELLESGLDALCEPGVLPLLALVVFELRFLAVLGLAPALEHCSACQGPAPALRGDGDRAAFSAGMGGRLCAGCARLAREAGKRVGTLPRAMLESAARLASLPLGVALAGLGSEAGRTSRSLLEQVHLFDLRFLDYHLETTPRSERAFLAQKELDV